MLIHFDAQPIRTAPLSTKLKKGILGYGVFCRILPHAFALVLIGSFCGVAHAGEATAQLCLKVEEDSKRTFGTLLDDGYRNRKSVIQPMWDACRIMMGKRITEESSAAQVNNRAAEISACFAIACGISKEGSNCLTLSDDIYQFEVTNGQRWRWGCP